MLNGGFSLADWVSIHAIRQIRFVWWMAQVFEGAVQIFSVKCGFYHFNFYYYYYHHHHYYCYCCCSSHYYCYCCCSSHYCYCHCHCHYYYHYYSYSYYCCCCCCLQFSGFRDLNHDNFFSKILSKDSLSIKESYHFFVCMTCHFLWIM